MSSEAAPSDVQAQALFGNGQILDAIREIAAFLRSDELKGVLSGIREIVDFIKSLIPQAEAGAVSAQAVDPGTIAMVVQLLKFVFDLIKQWKASQQPVAAAA